MAIDKFRIIEKSIINHNIVSLKVEIFDKKTSILPFTVSSCVKIFDDKGNSRPYTPIEITSTKMIFYIKIYEKGILTQYINKRNVGDIIKIEYFLSKKFFEINKYKNICMIAGGTGLTPCLQVLKYSTENKKDKTKFTLINLNNGEKDKFLIDEINSLIINSQNLTDSKLNYPRIKYVDILTEDSYNNNYIKTYEYIKKIITLKNENFDFIYVCGPPSFMKGISGDKNTDKTQGDVTGILKEIGFSSDNVYKF